MHSSRFRLANAAALMALAVSYDNVGGGEGPPRRDRHGRHVEVEPTQFTTPKHKSAALKKLLRK